MAGAQWGFVGERDFLLGMHHSSKRRLCVGLLYVVSLSLSIVFFRSYLSYQKSIADLDAVIYFTELLYLLNLPLAFVFTHLGSLASNAIIKILKGQEAVIFIVSLIVILALGLVVQEWFRDRVEQAGYVRCESYDKSGLRSETIAYVSEVVGCQNSS